MGIAHSVTVCEGETQGGRALCRRVLWECQPQSLRNTFAIGRISFVDVTKLPLLNLPRNGLHRVHDVVNQVRPLVGVSLVGWNESNEF